MCAPTVTFKELCEILILFPTDISTRKHWKMQDYFHSPSIYSLLYSILCRSWDKTVCIFTRIHHGQPRVWKSRTWFIPYHSVPSNNPELFTRSAAWIRGSRTQTSRQMVNLLNECHGECIGFWLGEFEIHLFIRCKKQSKG